MFNSTTNKAMSMVNGSSLFHNHIKNAHFLRAQQVEAPRQYIKKYWKKLTKYHPKNSESLLGLPFPYLVPASETGHEFDFNEMYYWDSYFMVQGLLDEEHKDLVIGILNNLLYMQKKYNIVPNASRMYLTGRSQPPFLTSFIFDVYDTYHMSNNWLKNAIAVAKSEYKEVWTGKSKPHWRQVYKGLSRYFDINMLHDLAETESGWDMTSRFNRRALDYVPIDLNSLLYKYETDFARAAEILHAPEEAAAWRKKAKVRANVIDKLMWSNLKGLYFDYNYVKEKRGVNASLATFYPLWAGMVSPKKAKRLVKSLKRFEQKGGLATTDVMQLTQLLPGMLPTQWAYPNGWAPLHFLVVQGLERYGFYKEAAEIVQKWLTTNLEWFNKHGVFLEKYNVVQPDKPPALGVYPSQIGFGWTNAIFERFCRDYIDGRKN